MSFTHDTEIDPKLATAKNYNKLLSEIPIQGLYDALTLEQISNAIKAVFAVLKKMRYQNSYPLDRALSLSEAIARDFDAQLKKVITSAQIMLIDYNEHKAMTNDIFKLQETWKECIEELKQSVANKINTNLSSKNRSEIDERLNTMSEDPVCKRLNAIITFRSDHDKLEQVIVSTFSKQE
jgi:dynein heavy chain 1, cytosolic